MNIRHTHCPIVGTNVNMCIKICKAWLLISFSLLSMKNKYNHKCYFFCTHYLAWFIYILGCMYSTLEIPDLEHGLVEKLWTMWQSEHLFKNLYHTHWTHCRILYQSFELFGPFCKVRQKEFNIMWCLIQGDLGGYSVQIPYQGPHIFLIWSLLIIPVLPNSL